MMLSRGKMSAGNSGGLGIIIQARMGSTRLPGKVLKELGNKTLLEHIFFRLGSLKHEAEVVVATSNLPIDDVIEDLCRRKGIACFRGNENNVLERYYSCAKKYGFKHIVRLTADNPFTDIEELDNLIDLHLGSGDDYTDSLGSLPIGVGAEIFSFPALEKTYLESKMPNHFEHVTEYIIENPSMFKCAVLKTSAGKCRNDIRLTVDTEADYKLACRIVGMSKHEHVGTLEAIRIAEEIRRKPI